MIAMVMIGIVGYGLDKLMVIIERRLQRWRVADSTGALQCLGGRGLASALVAALSRQCIS